MKNLTKEQLIKKLTEERDLAIKQLNSIGVGLGDNMDHVKKALEQRWIPCSERLPKEPEYGCCGYIVQRKTVEEPHSAWWDGELWTSDVCDIYVDVVAYMPLPEPYKDGE